jgi:hypothetical protein
MPEGQFFIPQNIPQTPSQTAGGNESGYTPNQIRQAPSFEQQSQVLKVAARGKKIKAGATAIINTRQDLKSYLANNGIELYTSAIDFQETGDFILSSYVVFKAYNGYQETLANFLQRYPQLQQSVEIIRDKLRPAQAYMEVSTKVQVPKYYDFGAEITIPTNYHSHPSATTQNLKIYPAQPFNLHQNSTSEITNPNPNSNFTNGVLPSIPTPSF